MSGWDDHRSLMFSYQSKWATSSNRSFLFRRVQAICNCLQGSPSEAVSFTTLSCEPDRPNAPKKASGTKNTLLLQWKVKKKYTGWLMQSSTSGYAASLVWQTDIFLIHVKVCVCVAQCTITIIWIGEQLQQHLQNCFHAWMHLMRQQQQL